MFRPMTLAALSLLLTVSACKKNDDTGEPRDFVPPPSESDSGDSKPAPKIPTEMRFKAFIAWDAANQEIVAPIIDGVDNYRSALIFELFEDGIQSDYCTVSIAIQGLTLSPDAKGEGYAWGVDIPSGRADEMQEDCSSQGWDLDEFYEGTRPEDWLEHAWSLRFYAPLSADLEDWLTPDTPTADFDINEFTGGAVTTVSGAYTPSEQDSNYWYGWPMSLDREVDFDAERLNANENMLDVSGDMAQGYYVLDQNVYWILDGDSGT